MDTRLILAGMGITCILISFLTIFQLDRDELDRRQWWLIYGMAITGLIMIVFSVPPLVGTTIIVIVISSTIFAWRNYQRLPQV